MIWGRRRGQKDSAVSMKNDQIDAATARSQALILVAEIRKKLDGLEHTLTLIEKAQDIHEVQGRGRQKK